MTTEATPSGDVAARLGALRQRRPERPAERQPGAPVQAPGVPRRRARRRHAATGGRILAGSLSAAVALSLMGVMADADRTAVGAASAPDGTSAGRTTVLVVGRPAGAPSENAAPTSPPVAPSVAAPVSTSRGS